MQGPRALRRRRVRQATARPLSIEEKPKQPREQLGRHRACTSTTPASSTIAKSLKPSARGELEITDVNRALPRARAAARSQPLGRGVAWLDTGTHDSLLSARMFVQTLEQRQGLKIACIEEIALRQGVHRRRRSSQKLAEQAGKSEYGQYLMRVLRDAGVQ